jgi:hypothetical protein
MYGFVGRCAVPQSSYDAFQKKINIDSNQSAVLTSLILFFVDMEYLQRSPASIPTKFLAHSYAYITISITVSLTRWREKERKSQE